VRDEDAGGSIDALRYAFPREQVKVAASACVLPARLTEMKCGVAGAPAGAFISLAARRSALACVHGASRGFLFGRRSFQHPSVDRAGDRTWEHLLVERLLEHIHRPPVVFSTVVQALYFAVQSGFKGERSLRCSSQSKVLASHSES
jgi:hypothetical protein